MNELLCCYPNSFTVVECGRAIRERKEGVQVQIENEKFMIGFLHEKLRGAKKLCKLGLTVD